MFSKLLKVWLLTIIVGWVFFLFLTILRTDPDLGYLNFAFYIFLLGVVSSSLSIIVFYLLVKILRNLNVPSFIFQCLLFLLLCSSFVWIFFDEVDIVTDRNIWDSYIFPYSFAAFVSCFYMDLKIKP